MRNLDGDEAGILLSPFNLGKILAFFYSAGNFPRNNDCQNK